MNTSQRQKWVDAARTWLRASGIADAPLRAGEIAPDFLLPRADGAGGEVASGEILDRGRAIVLFTLGAASAPCCNQLSAWQRSLAAARGRGATVLAISTDPPPVARRLADRLAIGFDLACDPDAHVAHLFGLTYRPPWPLARWYGLLGLAPDVAAGARVAILPAVYAIERSGLAVYAMISPDPFVRPRPSAVIGSLD
jgi:peroxiredoxin